MGQLAGQYASDALYSAEEFGVGGSRFGRGFDPSEITGDHGVAFAAELRYTGLSPWQNITFSPFVFYDIGAVWNEDTGQRGRVSAASAGGGVYTTLPSGVQGVFTLARPLTYDAATPLYGSKGEDIRFLFSLNAGF